MLLMDAAQDKTVHRSRAQLAKPPFVIFRDPDNVLKVMSRPKESCQETFSLFCRLWAKFTS